MKELRSILFIDIETVPAVPRFEDLAEGMQYHWEKKSKFLRVDEGEEPSPAALFHERSGVYSEFAKVICIGLGCIAEENKKHKILLKALADDDEKNLLNKFCEAITKFTEHAKEFRFCGHNIREFDIPFLCRRMLIHGMELPDCLQLHGKKPWEVTHLDTLELWRFGDYKHYTSLGLLAEVLNVPSSKTDMDGSMVGKVYWQDKNLERIKQYCLQDVLTTARIYLRIRGVNKIALEPQYLNEA